MWLKCCLFCLENIMEKGENASYQHFLLFPQCFQNASFPGLLRIGNEYAQRYLIMSKFSHNTENGWAMALNTCKRREKKTENDQSFLYFLMQFLHYMYLTLI